MTPSHILIGTRSGTRGEGSNATSAGRSPAQSPAARRLRVDGRRRDLRARRVPARSTRSSSTRATRTRCTRRSRQRDRRAAPLDERAARPALDADLPAEPRARFTFSPVRCRTARRASTSPTRVARRADGRAGLPRRRREPAGRDADRVEQRCVDAPVEPDRRHARLRRLQLLQHAARRLAVLLRHVRSCRRPIGPDMVVVGGLMHYEELKPYVAGARSRHALERPRGADVDRTPARRGTDMTGDVGGESMHPDQHAIAFVPGNPDQFFVGSDGGVIRTSGKWADASSQCDDRGLSASIPGRLPGVAQPHPERAEVGERRARHAADEQHRRQPVSRREHRDDGDAGQRHARPSPARRRGTCRSPVTAATAASTPRTRTSASTPTPAGRWTSTTTTSIRRPGSGSATVHRQRPGGPALLRAGDLRPARDEDDLRRRAERLAHAGRRRRPRVPRGALQHRCRRVRPSDLLYTGACGSAADWPKLGIVDADETRRLALGTTKGGDTLTALSRGRDAGTMWAATGVAACSSRRTCERADRRASRSRGSTRRRSRTASAVVDLRRPDEREPRDRDVLGLRRQHADDARSRVRRRVRPGDATPRRGRTSRTTSATSR